MVNTWNSLPNWVLSANMFISVCVDDIGILPESQCGFRAGRSTMDMIFTARPELHAGRVDPRVGSGRVGSENLQIRVGRVGSGPVR